MKPLDAIERKLAETTARVIVKAAEIGLPDAPEQLCSPRAIRLLAHAYVELLAVQATTTATADDPRVAIYHRAMGNTIDFAKHPTFVVRQWDGMDGCWCDCTGAVGRDAALSAWAERTGNGTHHVTYAEITYYAIFPGDTHMLWDGADGSEMHR